MFSLSAMFRRSSSTGFLATSLRLITESTAVAGIFDGVLEALDEGAQEALHGLRLLGGEFRIDDDGVAVEIDAVVGHQQHDDVVDRHAVDP